MIQTIRNLVKTFDQRRRSSQVRKNRSCLRAGLESLERRDTMAGATILPSAFSDEFKATPYYNEIVDVANKSPLMVTYVNDFARGGGKFGVNYDNAHFQVGNEIQIGKNALFSISGGFAHGPELQKLVTLLAHELGHVRNEVDIYKGANSAEGAMLGVRGEALADLEEFKVARELNARMWDGDVQDELAKIYRSDINFDQQTEVLLARATAIHGARKPSSANQITYEEYYADLWIVDSFGIDYRKIDWGQIQPNAFHLRSNSVGSEIPSSTIKMRGGGTITVSGTFSNDGKSRNLKYSADIDGDGKTDGTGEVVIGSDGKADFTIRGANNFLALNNSKVKAAPATTFNIKGHGNSIWASDTAIGVVEGMFNYVVTTADSLVSSASDTLVLVWQNNTYNTPQLLSTFGSQVGSLIAGKNSFAKVGLSSVLSTFGDQLGRFLTSGNLLEQATGSVSTLDAMLDKALIKTAGGVTRSVAAGTYSTVASLLVSDAAQKIGLSGFSQQAFVTAGNTIAGQLFSNLTGSGTIITPSQLLSGFDTVKMVTSFGDAFGTLAAQQLTNKLINVHGIGQSLFASVGGTVGSLSFAQSIGGAIAMQVGIPTALGSAATGAAASTAIADMAFSQILTALIFPGFGPLLSYLGGAFIGAELFSALDSITGGFFTQLFSGGSTWHYQYVQFDPLTEQLVAPASLDFSKNTSAALRKGTYALTDGTLAAVNAVLKLVGGHVDATNIMDSSNLANFAWVGKNKSWGADDYQVEFGSGDNHVNAAGDAAAIVRMATVYDLSKIRIFGGDPLLNRAFNKWQSTLTDTKDDGALSRLYSILQVAMDSNIYSKNAAAINALMTAEPESSFTVGWLATLTQAESFGLFKNAAPAFKVTATTSVVAGAPATITVSALDSRGNVNTNFQGTVNFWSDDRTAQLPKSYTFSAADRGTHVFSYTMTRSGPNEFAVVSLDSSFGKTIVNVAPAAAVSISVSVGGPITPGAASNITVRVLDKFGNVATNYRGTVNFTSTDRSALLPASYTFTGADGGVHVFSAKFETTGLQTTTTRKAVLVGRLVKLTYVKETVKLDLTVTGTGGSGFTNTITVQGVAIVS